MCLLMVAMGVAPKREQLVNASLSNPHGYGFAVNHGDRIVTGRSMKYDNLIDRFLAEMERSDNPIGMFHARFTTHGSTTLENNHPFRVDGRKDIVLAHNGMLPIEPRYGDDRSDTRIFAEDILGSIGVEGLDDKHVFDSLEYFARGSKVAILSTAPELRDSVYILNENLGHWKGDIWWSNYGYEGSYFGYGGYSKPYSTDYKAWGDEIPVIGGSSTKYVDTGEMCYVCTTMIDEEDYQEGICSTCNSCLECFDHAVNCICYRPNSKHTSYRYSDDVARITDYIGTEY